MIIWHLLVSSGEYQLIWMRSIGQLCWKLSRCGGEYKHTYRVSKILKQISKQASRALGEKPFEENYFAPCYETSATTMGLLHSYPHRHSSQPDYREPDDNAVCAMQNKISSTNSNNTWEYLHNPFYPHVHGNNTEQCLPCTVTHGPQQEAPATDDQPLTPYALKKSTIVDHGKLNIIQEDHNTTVVRTRNSGRPKTQSQVPSYARIVPTK
jgi:hypothetical protein